MNTEIETQFCDAITSGDTPTTLSLLEENPALANTKGSVHPDHREWMAKNKAEKGWTALHLAAHYGQLEIAKALIAKGAKINTIADNAISNTPLHAAVAGGKAEIIALLIEAGADTELTDRNSFKPIDLAKQSQNQKLIELF